MLKQLMTSWSLLALVGCGTDLVVREEDRGQKDPKGLVVNETAIYKVSAESTLFKVGANEGKLSGIADGRVLILNISRDIFASGKLTMKLDERETPKEIGITGKPVPVEGVKAVTGALDKRLQYFKAKEGEK